jgi:hypothetical protein
VVAVVVVVVGLGMALSVQEIMPPNAVILVDDRVGIYYPLFPETIARLGLHLRRTTIQQADTLKYRPDPKSRDAGAFVGSEYSLLRLWLTKIGVTKPESRWAPDGSWRW